MEENACLLLSCHPLLRHTSPFPVPRLHSKYKSHNICFLWLLARVHHTNRHCRW